MAGHPTLPPDVLAHTAIMPVPGGGQPNFVDPYDKGPMEVGSAYFLIAFTTCFFINRIYVKAFVTKSLFWDDLTVSLAFAFAIIKTGGYIYMTTAGPIGKHQWDVSIAELSSRPNLIAEWVNNVWTPLSQCFIKLTLFLIYWQIFWVLRWVRIAIYIGFSITVVFYTAITVALFVLSTPRPGQTWAEQATSQNAINADQVQFANTSAGAIINLYLLCLPLRAVLKLQLPKTRKIRIGIACLLGFSACICTGGSIHARVVLWKSPDKTWNMLPVENQVIFELFIGLIVCNLPQFSVTMKKLYSPSVKRVRSYLNSRSSKQASSASRVSDESNASPRLSSRREPHEIGEKKTVDVFVEERSDSDHESEVMIERASHVV